MFSLKSCFTWSLPLNFLLSIIVSSKHLGSLSGGLTHIYKTSMVKKVPSAQPRSCGLDVEDFAVWFLGIKSFCLRISHGRVKFWITYANPLLKMPTNVFHSWFVPSAHESDPASDSTLESGLVTCDSISRWKISDVVEIREQVIRELERVLRVSDWTLGSNARKQKCLIALRPNFG